MNEKDFAAEFEFIANHLNHHEHAEVKLAQFELDDPHLHAIRKIGRSHCWSEHRIAVAQACLMAAKVRMLQSQLLSTHQRTFSPTFIVSTSPRAAD